MTTITPGAYGYALQIPVGNALNLALATSLHILLKSPQGLPSKTFVATAGTTNMTDQNGNVIYNSDGVTPTWPAGTWVTYTVQNGDFTAAMAGVYNVTVEFNDATRQLYSTSVPLTVLQLPD